MEYRIKTQYIKKIYDDPLLYGAVAHGLKIKGPSFVATLKFNRPILTQKKVLKIISDYLNVPESDLVEPIEETEAA